MFMIEYNCYDLIEEVITMDKQKKTAILYALLAAVFYAINVPISKILLKDVGPTTMAALLYLGAGIGIGILSLFNKKDREKSERLSKKDLPFVIGMIVLDIAAPIFLMLGISYGSSANASLLGNFEIVATTVIALFIFKEAVSKRLWAAIALITLSSILLSFEGTDSFSFSYGSLFVLDATVCWGFENNCTRNISSKSTYEIVVLKGVFSGLGALVIALIKRESIPGIWYIVHTGNLVYRSRADSWICGLRPEHFPLCSGAECSRRGKDQRILCSRAICRCLPVFCCSPRTVVMDVLYCIDRNARRICTRSGRYSDQASRA